MVDIEFIRKKNMVDGWSIRKISRQLKVARQTVRKALVSAEPPQYKVSQPRSCPVTGPYRDIIGSWLSEDQKAPTKQRHTATRVYDRLAEEYQFTGGESTVRRLVARIIKKQPEVFIPLEAAWGQQAQVDWGQAMVEMNGVPVVAHLFCLRMRASGVPFVWAAPTEKLEAFLEGHRRAFEWLEGVPAQCLYDNPKTAVARILAGPERVEHTVFSSLRAHYLFDSLFCRPGEAHEKGAVENLVGYVRRNALVPVPAFSSWDGLNLHLLAWCERDRTRLGERWEAERQHLRPLPAMPFRCSLSCLTPVSRLSLVTVDRNRYSVPCKYVGQTLRLSISTNQIEAWDGQERVVLHARCHLRGETLLKIEHYLPALAFKPRAATHAAVIGQMPPIYATVRERLCRARPDGYRDFVSILLLHQEFPAQAVARALEEALQRGCLQPASVRQLLLNQTCTPPPEPIPVPLRLGETRLSPPDLSRYNLLLEAVGL
ncbi:MAG: IS21 family transposase [Dehalococcoidia bacterium]|nr:IS21 family transposase [Dehalococcoidia bacterium]